MARRPQSAPAIAPSADRLSYLSDPDDPRFKLAMKHTCEVCGAKPTRPCWNTIDSEAPLPNRLLHIGRITQHNPKHAA